MWKGKIKTLQDTTIAKSHQGRHLSPQKPALSDVKGSCHSAPNSALAEMLNVFQNHWCFHRPQVNAACNQVAQKGCALELNPCVLSIVCWVCAFLSSSQKASGSRDCRRGGTFGAAIAHVGFGASALLTQQIPVMQPWKWIENVKIYKKRDSWWVYVPLATSSPQGQDALSCVWEVLFEPLCLW